MITKRAPVGANKLQSGLKYCRAHIVGGGGIGIGIVGGGGSGIGGIGAHIVGGGGIGALNSTPVSLPSMESA